MGSADGPVDALLDHMLEEQAEENEKKSKRHKIPFVPDECFQRLPVSAQKDVLRIYEAHAHKVTIPNEVYKTMVVRETIDTFTQKANQSKKIVGKEDYGNLTKHWVKVLGNARVCFRVVFCFRSCGLNMDRSI